jgi:hypothetical protein
MTLASRRLVIAALAAPSAAGGLVVALVVTAFAALASDNTATGGGQGTDPAIRTVACAPAAAAPGLATEQTANAAVIMAAAETRGLGPAGAVIGVMTALTESSLLNVNHGDTAGPDSRGLFQQRDSWGPAAVRMEPAGAAGLFFDRLGTIDGWQDLPPWVAAQRVQHSAFADGSNYAANYHTAVAAVREIAGSSESGSGDTAGVAAAGSGGFDVAAFCGSDTGGVADGGWGGFSNGEIPASALCPLTAVGQLLRCDAAAAWDAMSAAFEADTGTPICITDSYRSLAMQVRLRAEKPILAAIPGTSNHGWALAVDLCEFGRTGMGYATPTYEWLKANAARFGWVHPAWAEPGRGQEEPWHWEYVGGTS